MEFSNKIFLFRGDIICTYDLLFQHHTLFYFSSLLVTCFEASENELEMSDMNLVT